VSTNPPGGSCRAIGEPVIGAGNPSEKELAAKADLDPTLQDGRPRHLTKFRRIEHGGRSTPKKEKIEEQADRPLPYLKAGVPGRTGVLDHLVELLAERLLFLGRGLGLCPSRQRVSICTKYSATSKKAMRPRSAAATIRRSNPERHFLSPVCRPLRFNGLTSHRQS
jgi:hypothetical protein